MAYQKNLADLKRDLDKTIFVMEKVEQDLSTTDAHLECMKCTGFDRFYEMVLRPRLDHLAHRGMNLPEADAISQEDEQRLRDRLQGQYNESRWLSAQRFELEERKRNLEAQLVEARKQRTALTAAWEKEEKKQNARR